MRHLPNTWTGCFRLALFGKPRHWGQSECSSLIGWFLDMVYFQQWSRTESKTPHVTLLGRSYWISYIHTRSKKTKETKKLIYSIGNFLCNKNSMFLPSCRKLPAKHFHHIDETEPFSVFVNGTVLQFLYQMELWLWWHREGFHLSPSWLVTKRTKWFFSLSEQ